MSATQQDVIEGTAVEESPRREMAVVPAQPLPAPALAVTPTVKATELVERLDVIRDALQTAMIRDVDYGKVPGTDKPTLLKPGAEKLGVLFQLDVQLVNEKRWGPGDHLTVESRATVFHAPSGARLGFGEGMCSTRERKYGKRAQRRACPQCGAHQINRSRFAENGESQPGWYCWQKKGGCGAKFSAADPAILGQPEGEVENPDLPDCWNTVVKMAEKRARVDAILAVTGASALFTQDAEDLPREDVEPEDVEPRQQTRQPPPSAPTLPEDLVQQVIAALVGAKRGQEWMRMQLIEAGAVSVPSGQIMRSTVEALTVEQADRVLLLCAEAAEARS